MSHGLRVNNEENFPDRRKHPLRYWLAASTTLLVCCKSFGFDMMPPTEVKYVSTFVSGRYYEDPHTACKSIATSLNSGQYKTSDYLNPRYGVRPQYGPGCYYDLRNVKTGSITYNVHYQNWVNPVYSCLPGYDGPYKTYQYHSWGDDICRLSNSKYTDTQPASCTTLPSTQGYQARAVPIQIPGLDIDLQYYSKPSTSTYRSGSLGIPDWSSPLNSKLRFAYSPVYQKIFAQLTESEFTKYLFKEDSPGVFTAWGTGLSLTNENGSFVLHDQAGGRRVYSSEGNLIGFQPAGEPFTTIEYYALDAELNNAGYGMIKSISSRGHVYSFRYQQTRLHRIEWEGGEATFQYENGKLTKIVYPDQEVSIAYEDGSNCLRQINLNGQPQYTSSCTAQGQLLQELTPSGSLSYSYLSDGYVVTNSLGKRTRYQFSVIASERRLTKISGEATPNCEAAQRITTYYPNGLRQSSTDWKGNQTQFQYDSRGREVSRTEAVGTPHARTITTDWHPTLYLPATVTEPNRITTYEYDAQGRQIGQSITER
ncbi:hypothetical protein E8F20_00115 [Pseudomonas sp. BN415]|uniref:RHS repeat domain-containing protein n=1 Tax=Pseudomonas sp. BN415 TaxID=2567889 RepID=UPI0024581558|nr:RHS repeat protein [Pseudomonas sp. BN415]MDH4580273.1 hypothetical protein [Pseudomonas sp. BN415]